MHGGAMAIALTVEDNGVGFDIPSVGSRGLGLLGAEERVRELGGRMEILSQLSKGTLLRCEDSDLDGSEGMATKTKILVADDHGIVRQGLRSLLEKQQDMEVVGEAGDGREAVRMAEELDPHIIVMDIALPHLNGIDAAEQVLRTSPEKKIILLSMYADEEFLMRALTVGVKGYLLKDSAELDLVRAVRAVAAGKSFFSPAIAQTLAEDYVRQLQCKGLEDSYDLLTPREKEIIQLLAEGKSNKDVATVLDVSPYTVETHRMHLMQKLSLHNTAEIVLYAVRKKIIA